VLQTRRWKMAKTFSVTSAGKHVFGELDDEKLPDLIKLKYETLQDGLEGLGVAMLRVDSYIDFQKYLYQAG
jgi:hypothetical protein